MAEAAQVSLQSCASALGMMVSGVTRLDAAVAFARIDRWTIIFMRAVHVLLVRAYY